MRIVMLSLAGAVNVLDLVGIIFGIVLMVFLCIAVYSIIVHPPAE